MKKIEIITPVYNEEKNIGKTIESFFSEYKDTDFDISFIISEDGSTDNTKNILSNLSKTYNLNIFTSKERKNYTDAVLYGLRKSSSDIISFVDSDGQYDPKDLKRLYENLQKGQIVIGYRHPRVDNIFRLVVSNTFKKLYKFFLRIDLKDPSCGYFIAYRKDVIEIIENEDIGYLKEGFWWEFYARCIQKNLDIIEIPIKHFNRHYGNTVVFKFSRIPGIAFRNFIGLLKLKKDLKNS